MNNNKKLYPPKSLVVSGPGFSPAQWCILSRTLIKCGGRL